MEFVAQMAGQKKYKIILIDVKKENDFLPLLPDVLAGYNMHRYVTYNLASFCRRYKAEFVNAYVKYIDIRAKMIILNSGTVVYDKLVIASGLKPDFYGQHDKYKDVFVINSIYSMKKLNDRLLGRSYKRCIVAGGGYTGIEAAGAFKRRFPGTEVVLVEKAPEILSFLPERLRKYALEKLTGAGIKVQTGACVDEYISDESILLWAAGVKGSECADSVMAKKTVNGRIIVRDDMRLGDNDNIYAIGDAAAVEFKGAVLRPCVPFAVQQGRFLAGFFKRGRVGRYKPFDPGYIIPAGNSAVGRVMGIYMKGKALLLLHYLTAVLKSKGIRNRMGVFKSIFLKRRKNG